MAITLPYGTSSISSANVVQNSNGTITQTERLFTIRERGTNTAEQGGGDRGTRAYIRLMTTDAAASLSRATSQTAGIGGTSLSASGGPLDNAINGNNNIGGYANFFVTDIRCSLDEKLQVTQTFGDGEVAYYFGKQPITLGVSGYIFDSQDNSWFVEFLSMYGQVLRGTQLARNYELVKLVLPNMYVIGSMTHVDWSQNSNSDVDVGFSFQFLVKQLVPIAIVAAGVPTSSSSSLINFSAIPNFTSQADINTVKGSFSSLQSLIQDPTSTTSAIASGITGLGSGLSAGISDISNYTDPGSGSNSYGFTTDGSGSLSSSTTSSSNSTSTSLASSNTGSADIFNSVNTNLTGIRASLLSPIYGVLSSLTKLVKSAAGSVDSIFNALTSPVRDIIRTVQDVSSQAIGIVNLVNNTIQGLTNQTVAIDNQSRIALADLTNVAGVITSVPKTIFQSLGELVSAGTLPLTMGYLQDQPIASLSSSGTAPSKIALLNSGAKYTPQAGASL